MRLIDADKLKADFIGKRYGVQAIEYVIDQQPTVDAEPVVRCKDCEYWGTKARTIDNDGNTMSCDCLALDGMTKADFYCAWGERKEDGTSDN